MTEKQMTASPLYFAFRSHNSHQIQLCASHLPQNSSVCHYGKVSKGCVIIFETYSKSKKTIVYETVYGIYHPCMDDFVYNAC